MAKFYAHYRWILDCPVDAATATSHQVLVVEADSLWDARETAYIYLDDMEEPYTLMDVYDEEGVSLNAVEQSIEEEMAAAELPF